MAGDLLACADCGATTPKESARTNGFLQYRLPGGNDKTLCQPCWRRRFAEQVGPRARRLSDMIDRLLELHGGSVERLTAAYLREHYPDALTELEARGYTTRYEDVERVCEETAEDNPDLAHKCDEALFYAVHTAIVLHAEET